MLIGIVAAGLVAVLPAPGAGGGASAADAVGTPIDPAASMPVSGGHGQPIIVSQVHNAPGWRRSHIYRYATGPRTRVVNGPGWNHSRGTYDPGKPLNAYELTSKGDCVSGTNGGPSGKVPSIHDGTCTWKYLSPVDYISITGWALDNPPWRRRVNYRYRDYVTSDSPLRVYALENDACTSATAPSGIGRRSIVETHDGCKWRYFADIVYSSRKSHIPTQKYRKPKKMGADVRLDAHYKAELWNDREYVAGQHGEASPIRLQAHNDLTNGVGTNEHENGRGCMPCYHLVVATAPGESFVDSLTPADPFVGYDPTKGVAIRYSDGRTSPTEAAGFLARDNYVDFTGLQIKSDTGPAVEGIFVHGNSMTIRNSILEGGGAVTVTVDAGPSLIANSLVIAHGKIGIASKYPMIVLHSTIVNPDRTAGSVGVETGTKWYFDDSTISNTAIFGFTHAAAHLSAGTSWSSRSSNNVTDATPDGAGTRVDWVDRPSGSTVDRLPNTNYRVSAKDAFVAFGKDWRLARKSPLRGAGAAYGTFPAYPCSARRGNCPAPEYNFDSPDIIGTARPQDGRYDIGAWQSPSQSASHQ